MFWVCVGRTARHSSLRKPREYPARPRTVCDLSRVCVRAVRRERESAHVSPPPRAGGRRAWPGIVLSASRVNKNTLPHRRIRATGELGMGSAARGPAPAGRRAQVYDLPFAARSMGLRRLFSLRRVPRQSPPLLAARRRLVQPVALRRGDGGDALRALGRAAPRVLLGARPRHAQ